jgi:hypothetical protein
MARLPPIDGDRQRRTHGQNWADRQRSSPEPDDAEELEQAKEPPWSPDSVFQRDQVACCRRCHERFFLPAPMARGWQYQVMFKRAGWREAEPWKDVFRQRHKAEEKVAWLVATAAEHGLKPIVYTRIDTRRVQAFWDWGEEVLYD